MSGISKVNRFKLDFLREAGPESLQFYDFVLKESMKSKIEADYLGAIRCLVPDTLKQQMYEDISVALQDITTHQENKQAILNHFKFFWGEADDDAVSLFESAKSMHSDDDSTHYSNVGSARKTLTQLAQKVHKKVMVAKKEFFRAQKGRDVCGMPVQDLDK